MKSIVELLSDLIRIPSNSAVSNRPVVEYVARVLHSAGWSVLELPYKNTAKVEQVNLIAAPPGQDVAHRDVDLVFMCHTDTVPYAAEWAAAPERPDLNDVLAGPRQRVCEPGGEAAGPFQRPRPGGRAHAGQPSPASARIPRRPQAPRCEPVRCR